MTNENNPLMIEGKNPVWEALKAGRPMDKLLINKELNQQTIKGLLGLARRSHVLVDFVPKAKLDTLSETGRHQGLIALLPAAQYTNFHDMLDQAFAKSEAPLIVILDQIQDPYNLGAIIRSAECAGAQGIVIPERRSAGLTAVVARASAGAIEHVPIAKVKNLSDAIKIMKDRGLWVIGTDSQGSNYHQVDMKGPTAIVIGNEGDGMRRLTKEACDQLAGIPLQGKVESLNASVAAGVLLFEVVRQRQQ